jgi:hypothetical protein
MTNWTITCGAVAVTLPKAPSEIIEEGGGNIEEFAQDGDEPVLIVPNLSSKTLTIQGSIYVEGQNNSYLETNYLSKLRGMKGKEVALTTPGGQYDGDWIFKNFVFRRVAEGAFARYAYVIIFSQGADAIIL